MSPIIRVYIAAKFSDQSKARQVRDWLRSDRIEVTATWIEQEGEFDDMTDRERAYCAFLDVHECSRADGLIYLPNVTPSHGRCTELGMKLLQGDPVIILGEKEKSVFQYLPNVFAIPGYEHESVDVLQDYVYDTILTYRTRR